MVTHKFVGINGRENYNKLWEELAAQLNSMGFGIKDSKKWQEVFGKWKSKIKTKAQDIICGMKKTGGGGPLPQLAPIEERLMDIIGWKIVTGDENMEMGRNNTFTEPKEAVVGVNQSQIENAAGTSATSASCFRLVPKIEKPLNVLSSACLELPALTLLNESCSKITTTKCIKPAEEPCTSLGPSTPIKNMNGKERKRKLLNSSHTKTPRYEQSNLVNMHSEHIQELKNVNLNLSRIADNQETQNRLFAQILESFKSK